jgi:hypothetical protein
MDALNSVDKNSDVYTRVLFDLRNGSDSYSKYIGFTYEDNVTKISDWEVRDLLEDKYIEEEDFDAIINHLINIGYDFEKTGAGDAIENIKALKELKLVVGRRYDIDKGRKLVINKVNFDATDKPYNITITDSDGTSKSGNIGFDALKNLKYNMSLFERR